MPARKRTKKDGDNGVEAPQEKPALQPDPEGNVGELSEQARIALNSIQQSQNNFTMELGRMEIRKGQILANIQQLQGQAQRILNSEAERIGIPAGTPWQVTPEGKARLAG